MARVLSFVIVAALFLGACDPSVLEPLSETRLSNQTRPGGQDGAADGEDPPLTPAEEIVHTVGIITAAPSFGGPDTFLIEEYPDRPMGPGAGPVTTGDKYHVTVTANTQIRLRQASGEGRVGSVADIAVGMMAEVWFVGPIRESYPAQATAGRIALFESDR
jgi:hypothetical protein